MLQVLRPLSPLDDRLNMKTPAVYEMAGELFAQKRMDEAYDCYLDVSIRCLKMAWWILMTNEGARDVGDVSECIYKLRAIRER